MFFFLLNITIILNETRRYYENLISGSKNGNVLVSSLFVQHSATSAFLCISRLFGLATGIIGSSFSTKAIFLSLFSSGASTVSAKRMLFKAFASFGSSSIVCLCKKQAYGSYLSKTLESFIHIKT
uniref:CSON003935 protein n=1 Tax=Culicoides sonorensis TaxID=179676 RepID=A0A336L3W1_CULSO